MNGCNPSTLRNAVKDIQFVLEFVGFVWPGQGDTDL